MPTLSTFFARLIARELTQSKTPWQELLQDVGLQPDDILTKPTLSLSQFNQFLINALNHSDDPALGLRFGRHGQLFPTGPAGLAGLYAPTLRDALNSIHHFSRLQADYMAVHVEVGTRYLRLRASEDKRLEETRRTQHEVMLLSLQNAIERILGRPFSEGRYYFAFAPPSYRESYSQHYHSAVEFNANASGIDVPRHLLNTPSPFYDETLWQQGQARAQSLMREFNSRQKQLHSHQVLQILRSHTPPLPGVQQTARLMALSERSFLRHLSFEGRRFRELQQRVQMEWSHHFLVDTQLSVETIAAELGYQDSANFRRAFKRWQGTSPARYRAQHQNKS
ncbi:MAG: hypothetical protein CL693_15770 [Cellvibrionaceae bacterium]|nr:hypothetical protein [Cellvibrionaceae bacterium]|tara:strand:- start:26553 stop:27563 length:1011 start_codon:yes stop_codon:yes gene_type:complete